MTNRIIATLCLRKDFGQLANWILILILLWLPLGGVLADDAPTTDVAETTADVAEERAEMNVEKNDDDTAEVDTDTTVDRKVTRRGLTVDGDLRPIFNAYDRDRRNGTSKSDEQLGFRTRFLADFGLSDSVHDGARLAGVCYVDDCNLEFVLNSTPSTNSGLKGGEFTFDELYLHWFRTERGSFAVGRLQTRAVLRSGVYAKSLDRNNSNNVNVNWTDGFLAIYRAQTDGDPVSCWNETTVTAPAAFGMVRSITTTVRRAIPFLPDSRILIAGGWSFNAHSMCLTCPIRC